MPWVYKVSTHSFYLNGTHQFDANYSGSPGYKDDSAYECVKNKGPIPRGTYTIGPAISHKKTKAWTMRLTPYIVNQTCGRDGFMIHGDNSSGLGNASNGCIILSLPHRKIINSSTDKILVVED